MKKHDLKVSILRFLMLREMHGYEIGRQLSNDGVGSQLSYVYQVLSEMKNEGLIKSYWKRSNSGPKIKVYGLETRGWQELQATLKNLVNNVHEFYIDYLARLPPEQWLLKWERMITDIVPDLPSKTIVFVAAKAYALKAYRYALEFTCQKTGRDIYLITDKSSDLNLNLRNLVTMSGSHAEIPLRADFADVVLAFDPPKPKTLNESVAEFSRVVRRDGAAAIGYPSIEKEDPLTIGAFIEKIHYELDASDFPDDKTIVTSFEKCFQTVTKMQAADFTFFIGRDKKFKNMH
jgi:DNA-binding PadR family transcriptional regulator